MKRLFVVAGLLAITPALALAQNLDRTPRGQGYVFFGGASHEMGPTFGFGGEGYLEKGLGIGAELGVTGQHTAPNLDAVLGLGSLDGSYHFFPKKIVKNAAPYVSGGYTVFFGHNTHTGTGLFGHKPLMTQGYNVGGGVDYCATRHLGMRLDVRYYGHGGRILDYTFPDVAQFTFVAFRVGLTFRKQRLGAH